MLSMVSSNFFGADWEVCCCAKAGEGNNSAHTHNRERKFLHKPGIVLCPGGTPDISRWRNHRMQSTTSSSPGGQPRTGDRQGSVCRPSAAGNRFLDWPRCV